MQRVPLRRREGRGADDEGPRQPVRPGPADGRALRGRQRHSGSRRAALALAAALDLDSGRLERRQGTP